MEFFPKEDVRTEGDERIDALLPTAKQLNDEDVEVKDTGYYYEMRESRKKSEQKMGSRGQTFLCARRLCFTSWSCLGVNVLRAPKFRKAP